MQGLKLKNRAYFQKEYIKPAVEKSLIEMTIPDKPNTSVLTRLLPHS